MSLTNSPDHDAEIESLEALIYSQHGDTKLALKKLEGRTDPHSVRRRMFILIESNRLDDAAMEIRSSDLAESYVDLAASVLSRIGDISGARQCVAWAAGRDSQGLLHRTCFLFLDGAMQWAFRSRKVGERLLSSTLGEFEKSILCDIVGTVGPICDEIAASGRVESEVGSQLLHGFIDVLNLLNDRKAAGRAVKALLSRRPIPIKVGEALIQGIGEASSDIVARLWDEHPDSFKARWLSCVIQAHELSKPNIALSRAYSIEDLARTGAEREDLCELLYELSNADENELIKVRSVAAKLLGEESRIQTFFEAEQFLKKGHFDEAIKILESVRDDDDPRWLRIYANAKMSSGDSPGALHLFKRLGEIAPNPAVFKTIVTLAGEQGHRVDERAALEQALLLDSTDAGARWRFAMHLLGDKDFQNAAAQFERLRSDYPHDLPTRCNLAITYSHLGDFAKALAILAVDDKQPVREFTFIKTRALILEAMGCADDAFTELESIRTSNWDNPKFILLFMNICYAAGKESAAHEALVRLQHLQKEGAVDPKMMRNVSIEEITALVQNGRKRDDELHQLIIKGTMPWVTAAEIQSEVPLWSWILKTQPLDWIWDDPLNRVIHSIYSTNSFRVSTGPQSTRTLERIDCPPRGTKVVVDLSALITLQELGLLTRAADYFGSVYVPATYLSKIPYDTRRLLPHQLSQKQSAQIILSAVESSTIGVLDDGNHDARTWGNLSEYVETPLADRATYRLRDLLDCLHAEGKLTDMELGEAKHVAHQPPAAIGTVDALTLGSNIVVDGTTLESIVGIGLLERTLKSFGVWMRKADFQDVRSRSRAYDALEKAREKHAEFWSLLRGDSRFEFAPVRMDFELEGDEKEGRGFSFSAINLARERGLPLFADDRVCQAAILNERMGSEAAAFGTDTFISALLESNEIRPSDATRYYLRLIEWRYRFVLVPSGVLKALAIQYRAHPPGDGMRRIARYIHDCMRDVGLFGGLEQTTQPISIAIRLYQSWAQTISEVLVDLWVDENIDESFAEEFTKWAILECLPSPPRILNETAQASIASLTAMTVLSQSLVHVSSSRAFQRANRALRKVSMLLGVDDTEYLDIVARVVRKEND